jgi:ribosomal protein S27AE
MPFIKDQIRWDLKFELLNKAEGEMALKKSKMICPKCGDEMNHHADKLRYPAGRNHATEGHNDLGGIVEETHACPGCGTIESRQAD